MTQSADTTPSGGKGRVGAASKPAAEATNPSTFEAAEPTSEKGPVETTSPPIFEAAADREATERAARAAAPIAADVEAIGALAPEVRSALYRFLASLADNKLVLGRRYGEWCTGAPMLESAVAAAAMAQDELGHARSFYPLLRGFPEASEADTVEGLGWQDRPAKPMTALDNRFATWTDFVAANFLVDTALTVVLEAAVESPYEPLRQRARKIVQEEAPHWSHAEGWVRRQSGNPETAPRLEKSLAAAWDSAFTWYGQDDDPAMAQLVGANLLSATPDQLRSRLRARIRPPLEAAKLWPRFQDRSPSWKGWDPQSRRLRPTS